MPRFDTGPRQRHRITNKLISELDDITVPAPSPWGEGWGEGDRSGDISAQIYGLSGLVRQ